MHFPFYLLTLILFVKLLKEIYINFPHSPTLSPSPTKKEERKRCIYIEKVNAEEKKNINKVVYIVNQIVFFKLVLQLFFRVFFLLKIRGKKKEKRNFFLFFLI